MQSKFIGIFFIVAMSFSSFSHAKAEDFFRLSGGGLLISGVEMRYSEVIEMINKEKSWQRVGRNHYILNASVGGEFDVRLKFRGGELTEIVSKQLGRKDYR
ncbi:hypothetical protein [Moritella sp. Urea-trap-13]|uniref:hypothetical protein n=1 Tax=Moritella sp. Urea-trap-13 TaxID=2058327 RepID=UPI000C31DCB5|nr:hypothetical protein [Moritella sp. Urea-trap-13]PKH05247.1 hypothetical protein CXF93_18310 [Moritella sp. Urea-trap-13]